MQEVAMQNSLSTWALTIAAGMLAAGAATGIAGSASPVGDGVRCEISVEKRSGGVTLEGFVDAASSISGSYELVVTKAGGGGSSNIRQGGEFSAASGARTPLGTVMLAGDGGTYTAKLKIKWDGKSATCSESVHGSL
jgi:hypothetical protein